MANEESRNALQPTEDERRSSLPAVPDQQFDPADMKLKLQYFGSIAVPSAVVLEILGAQFPGIALAAGAGVAAAYFAKELHYVFEPGLRTAGNILAYMTRGDAGGSGRTMNRLMNKDWWLGQEIAPYAEADDEYEEDEDEVVDQQPSPRSRKVVRLADNLIIPAADLAGKAIFVAGIRRSGKTTLGVRIAEQMSQYDLPLFVPDLEGDWLSAAASTFKSGRVLGHPSAVKKYVDVRDFEPVTVNNADVAGFNILDEGAQAVLDMASYPTIDEACQVVVKIIAGLFAWTEQYEDERVPCQVYLDEAQRFLPQNLDDSIIDDRLVRQALLRSYMDIIAVGGKRGLSPVILTQRFSQVNKKIMAQSEVFFLLRQTNDNDLKRCMEYVNNTTATPEEIACFAQGEGVYIAATGEQLVTQFSPRESSGKRGATPTIDAAERYAQRRSKRETVVVDEPEDDEVVEARPVPHLRPVKSADEILLERGVAAYRNGATSLDKLMAALGLSTQHQARKLKPRIEAIIQQQDQQQMDAADGM